MPDDAKHLVGICAPRNEPVRITITAQGVAYLERLEQKEANETMRDIQKATAKTQIFMVAATSILAFLVWLKYYKSNYIQIDLLGSNPQLDNNSFLFMGMVFFRTKGLA